MGWPSGGANSIASTCEFLVTKIEACNRNILPDLQVLQRDFRGARRDSGINFSGVLIQNLKNFLLYGWVIPMELVGLS